MRYYLVRNAEELGLGGGVPLCFAFFGRLRCGRIEDIDGDTRKCSSLGGVGRTITLP